jgi:hypothetical protein
VSHPVGDDRRKQHQDGPDELGRRRQAEQFERSIIFHARVPETPLPANR